MPNVSQAKYQESLAPPWLRLVRGAQWFRALGSRKSQAEDAIRSGNIARFPSYTDAAALDRIGAERDLERYPTTTIESWRERLRQAFTIWKRAGTYTGVLIELLLCLGPLAGVNEWGITLFTGNGQWASITLSAVVSWFLRLQQWPGRSTYLLDPAARSFWNVFAVVIRTSNSNPSLSFSSASPTADLARRVVRKWKSGHSRVARFILVGKDTLLWGAHHFENQTLSTATLLKWGDTGMTWRGTSSPSKSVVWQPPESQ